MNKVPCAADSDDLVVHTIDYSMHNEARQRLVDEIKIKLQSKSDNATILIQSGETQNRYDTDVEPNFRQESNFQYLFGVKEPDCWGLIDVATGISHLFIPKLPAHYAIWCGELHPPSYFKQLYGVDEVSFTDEMPECLSKLKDDSIIYTLAGGVNSDSGLKAKEIKFDGMDKFTFDKTGVLYHAIVKCRVIKTKTEISLMRYVNDVATDAHIAVMQNCKPGLYEYQMESIFKHWCYYRGGARFDAYTCICASGCSGSILHYGHAGEPNDKVMRDGGVSLFDMGCEFHCYSSDVTCSFPTNGTFTDAQRVIHEAVLASQWAVMDAMKPGVTWTDMHALAYKVIADHLLKIGILTGDLSEILDADIPAVFMPHGLGHLMGLDVHDVGGYAPDTPLRSSRPGFASLRTARVLEEGMVITIEPGIYFNDYSLDLALSNERQSKYLVKEKIDQYRGFGGIRLEDDVVVTKDGIENLTSAPRTCKDIEAVMAGRITKRSELTLRYYRGFEF